MKMLRYLWIYSGRHFALALVLFAIFWHGYSVVSTLRAIHHQTRRVAELTATNIEAALRHRDLFALRNHLWEIHGDRVRSVRFEAMVSEAFPPQVRHVMVGEPPRDDWRMYRVAVPLIASGATIGSTIYAIDLVDLNGTVLHRNGFLYVLVAGFLLCLLVIVNLGSIKALVHLEKGLTELSNLTNQRSPQQLRKIITEQLIPIPARGSIAEPYAHVIAQFVTALERCLQLEHALTTEQAISGVAAQVAHDIRSPLAALRTAAAQRTDMPESTRILIRRAVQRIGDIANDLVHRGDAAPDTTASSPAEPSVELLSELVESLLSEKRSQYQERPEVEIVSALDASSYGLFAQVESRALQRVLSNLINNAVEAISEAGTVTVQLRPEGDRAVVTITDTGQGIPADRLPQLMQRGATYNKVGGMGLGLYHARTTVEAWGGRLELQSTEGIGTTVSLALAQAPAPAWFVPVLQLVQGQTVVILDDDPSIHQLWQARCDTLAADLTVHHCTTAAALRRWCHRRAADWYLCDHELLGEEMSGIALIDELALADRAILVTSHYAEPTLRAQCQRLGVRLLPKSLAGQIPLEVAPAGDMPHALRVLVLDDDRFIHEAWQMTQERLQFGELHLYHRYEAFLASPQAGWRYDLVFVDKNLPDSQYTTAAILAELKAQGQPRVILASGDGARVLRRDPQYAAADVILDEKVPQDLRPLLVTPHREDVHHTAARTTARRNRPHRKGDLPCLKQTA